MPKLAMYYPQGAVTVDELLSVRDALQTLTAEAASTKESQLTKEHVDFVPIPYGEEACFPQPVSIEIETLGFQFRKEKMSEQAMRDLKPRFKDILRKIDLPVDLDKPFIWLKFQDPAGSHV